MFNNFNEKIRAVIHFAYERSPAVKRRFDEAKVSPSQINTFQDLTKLPTLTKEDLMGLQKVDPPLGGFLTASPKDIGWIFASPGPVYVPMPEITAVARMFSNCGFKKGDIVLNSFSYHLVIAGMTFDSGLRSLGITVIPAGVGNTEIQAQIIRDLGVTGYVGTPSFLMTVIERAEKLGYVVRKDFKLRCAFVTGEMFPSSLRERLIDQYRIRVRQGYGLAEIGTVAYECDVCEGMHINEEGVVVEVIDPETQIQLGPGEVGEVVVTSLNRTFPLIRFKTGDLSSYISEPCKCGMSSFRLKGILGRIGQAVKVRGLFLHPKQLEQAASEVTEIGKIQAIVTRSGTRDELKLRIGLKDMNLSKNIMGNIENEIKAKIQELCKLKTDEVEFVCVDTFNEDEPAILDKRVW